MMKVNDRLVNLLTTSKVPHSTPADAIVIIDAIRTPVTKAKRGGLKDIHADELLSVVLKVFACRAFNPVLHLRLFDNRAYFPGT